MGASTPSFAYFCMSSKLFIMVISPNIRHSAAIAPIRAPLASPCTYIALHNKSRMFLHRNMFGSKPRVRLMTWQLWNPTLIFACHGAACFRSQDKMRPADGRGAGGRRPGGLGQRSRRGKLFGGARTSD